MKTDTKLVSVTAEAAYPRVVASPVCRGTIRRHEPLWEKLRQELDRGLVIVQAGTGYGKTAFLADFARQQAGSNMTPAAWLKLDRTHQDRTHLMKAILMAIQTVRPGAGTVTLDALSKSKEVHRRWDYFLGLCCSELRETDGGPAMLILDQYERVAASPAATGLLDRLASSLPKNLALVFSTRQPPGLTSISELRIRDGVSILAASDLRLTAGEVQELLRLCMGSSPSFEVIERVVARTGGWPAGVQLAGAFIALKGERPLIAFAGSQPEFYDFLCEGILEATPLANRSGLLSTALVDTVSPALAQLLLQDGLGWKSFAECPSAYPGLVAENEAGIAFRHNPVFHGFLFRKIYDSFSREELRETHVKLAEFYRIDMSWDSALYHLLQAEEYQRASEMVAMLADSEISANSVETVARWLDAFPEEQRRSRPWLLLYGGVVHRMDRDWDKALELYNQASDIFRKQNEHNGLARTLWYASQVLAYRRNQRLATLFASEALTYLDASESRSRAWILHSMGNSFFDLGQAEDSLKCHKEALDLLASAEDTQGQLMGCQSIAWTLHRLGRLKEAQGYYVRALELQGKTGDINMLCWLRAGLIQLRAMRGDYSDSVAGLTEVVEIARKHHLQPAEAFALLGLVDIYLDLGDYAEAETCHWQAQTACQGFEDDAPRIGLHLRRMELERRRGQPYLGPRAEPSLSLVDWIDASNLEITKIAHDLERSTSLLLERRYEDASQRAQDALALSKRIGARYHEAQARYLLGRVFLSRGDAQASAAMVEQLLPAAEAEGYASFYLRDPEATGGLLLNAFRHTPRRDRIGSLLLRLAAINEEIVAPLLTEMQPEPDRLPAVRQKLDALALDLARKDAAAGPDRASDETSSAEQPSPNARSKLEHNEMEIVLFGPMRVRRGGLVITDRAWRTSKAKELFAYLLTCSDRTATRDHLLEVLWPDLSIDTAVSNFHFTVHSLRRALEPKLQPGIASSYLRLSGRHYHLHLPPGTRIDVEEFKKAGSRALKPGRAKPAKDSMALLEHAAALYQDEYVSDLYADWTEPIRVELLEMYLNVLHTLAVAAFSRHEYDEVIRRARAILVKDCYMEEAHRLIMRAARQVGNPTLALRQYDELVRLLHEMGAQPEAATQELYQQVCRNAHQRT